MNQSTDTFQKFAKKSKSYDINQERKDKAFACKQSYKHVRSMKRMEQESETWRKLNATSGLLSFVYLNTNYQVVNVI